MNFQDTAQLASVGYLLALSLIAVAVAIVVYGDKMSRKKKK